MDKEQKLKYSQYKSLYHEIKALHSELDDYFLETFQRSLPWNEVLGDRWERSQKLGFGSDTSIYDSCFVFGNPKIGKHCWIGPFTILDGSGGLTIGDYCTVSSGVHIYTHDNVHRTLSGGHKPIDRQPVFIGNNVYIAPYAIITKGINIGNYCVIGTGSLVNTNIPDYSIVFGKPGKVVGNVEISENYDIKFKYFTNTFKSID